MQWAAARDGGSHFKSNAESLAGILLSTYIKVSSMNLSQNGTFRVGDWRIEPALDQISRDGKTVKNGRAAR
jgi:hypothetical protein